MQQRVRKLSMMTKSKKEMLKKGKEINQTQNKQIREKVGKSQQ